MNGRPLNLIADGDAVTLVPGNLGTLLTLLRLRRVWRLHATPLRTLLARTNVRLHLRAGWFGRVQLLPDTDLFFRLFLPRT